MPQNAYKKLKNQIKDLQYELDYELNIVLETILLYSGVKRQSLEVAKAYIANIDGGGGMKF